MCKGEGREETEAICFFFSCLKIHYSLKRNFNGVNDRTLTDSNQSQATCTSMDLLETSFYANDSSNSFNEFPLKSSPKVQPLQKSREVRSSVLAAHMHGVCLCILIAHTEVLTQFLSPWAPYEMNLCWILNQHTCVQSSA